MAEGVLLLRATLAVVRAAPSRSWMQLIITALLVSPGTERQALQAPDTNGWVALPDIRVVPLLGGTQLCEAVQQVRPGVLRQPVERADEGGHTHLAYLIERHVRPVDPLEPRGTQEQEP